MKKFYSILFISLFIIGLLPIVNTTHDPNDFWVVDATFPGQSFTNIQGSANFVWATSGRNIYRHDGSTWNLQFTTTFPIKEISVVSDTLAYSVGHDTNSGEVRKYAGTWATDTTYGSTAGRLTESVTMVSSSRIVVGENVASVGATARIRIYDGTSWTSAGTFSPQTNFEFTDSVSIPGNIVMLLYGNGLDTINYICTTTCGQLPISDSLFGVWGSSSSNVWGVSELGNIWFYNGITWTLTDSFSQQTGFKDIWGTSSNDIWSVGAAGFIIHYDGVSWTSEPSPTSIDLSGVWCRSVNVCWMVGGNTIFKYQVNSAIAHPSITGLNYDSNDLLIEVSQGTCLGNDVDFTILNNQGMVNDLDVYIIDGENDIVIQQIDDSQMFVHSQTWFHFNRTYPSGSYQAIVIVDIAAILTPDRFDVVPFSISKGSCFTSEDKSDIQTNFDIVNQKLDFLNQTTLIGNENHNYTNYLVNQTSSYVNLNSNNSHSHIDSHFVYTNNLLNSSFVLTWVKQFYTNNLINQTHAHIDSHFTYTNKLINETQIQVNLTLNGTVITELTNILNNITGDTTVLVQSATVVGESSTYLIWLLLIAISVILSTLQKDNMLIGMLGGIFALFALFYALDNFVGFLGTLALFISLGALGYAGAQMANEKKKKDAKKNLF